jgi:hypothetical protein
VFPFDLAALPSDFVFMLGGSIRVGLAGVDVAMGPGVTFVGAMYPIFELVFLKLTLAFDVVELHPHANIEMTSARIVNIDLFMIFSLSKIVISKCRE